MSGDFADENAIGCSRQGEEPKTVYNPAASKPAWPSAVLAVVAMSFHLGLQILQGECGRGQN